MSILPSRGRIRLPHLPLDLLDLDRRDEDSLAIWLGERAISLHHPTHPVLHDEVVEFQEVDPGVER